jgi:hypothetical protein
VGGQADDAQPPPSERSALPSPQGDGSSLTRPRWAIWADRRASGMLTTGAAGTPVGQINDPFNPRA